MFCNIKEVMYFMKKFLNGIAHALCVMVVCVFAYDISYNSADSTNNIKWYDSVNSKGKGFLQTAFSQTAIAAIKDTVVDNFKEQMSYDGTNGITEDYACGKTTDFAKANYAYQNTTTDYSGWGCCASFVNFVLTKLTILT